MKELSKVTKYNRLKTCKKQTRSANASEANEGCLSWGGGQKVTVTTFTQTQPAEGSNAKDKGELKAIPKKVAFAG